LRQALEAKVALETNFAGAIASIEAIEQLGSVQALALNGERIGAVLVEIDGVATYLAGGGSGEGTLVRCQVCGDSPEALRRVAERVRECFGAEPPSEADPLVPTAFWSGGGFAGSATWRRLELSHFDEIATNYPVGVRPRLERLMQFGPDLAPSGRLLLWHGEPGTGKTWALRALAYEWRQWCTLNYITDAERFLGANSDYLIKLLLEAPDSPYEREEPDEARWKLIVLEDASEFLAIDSHRQIGQSFSRLLNALDGLIGQGGRNLILISTNEPLGKLHPAILRPGRLLDEVEFHRFSAVEASQWLERQGVGGNVERELTLAELYQGLQSEIGPSKGQGRLGFR
jgi:hypothetical protein